jgi:hypothetical protein
VESKGRELVGSLEDNEIKVRIGRGQEHYLALTAVGLERIERP